MSQGRIQIRELPNNPTLRPAETAPDTFAGAARPVEDRNTENLVNALGFFNQNLASLGATMARDRKQGDEALAAQQETAMKMGDGTLHREAAETGMIGGQPIATARLKRMAGDVDSEHGLNPLQQEMTTMDLTNVDTDALILGKAEELMRGVADDPLIRVGWADRVDRMRDWARTQKANQILARDQQAVETTSFQFLRGKVNAWAQEGASPEEMHANIQALRQTVGVGRDRLTTPEMFDGQVMSVAAQLVETDPERAVALITQAGEGGSSLADDPRFSNQVANIVQRGEVVVKNREVQQGFAGRRQENFNRVLREGDTTAFQELTINNRTLTQKEQEAQFVQDLTADLNGRVQAGTVTKEQRRDEIARWTSRMNLPDPFIKEELDGIENRYSSIDAATQPDAMADIERRAQEYDRYKGSRKNFVLSQISDKSRKWYDAVSYHKRYVGPSTEAAAEFANQVVNPVGGEVNLTYRMEDISRGVKAKLSGFISSSSTAYSSTYEAQIRQGAELFVQAGMNVDHAIDAATEQVFDNTLHFEGDPLVGLEKAGVPEDYQEILGKMAEDYKIMDARGKAYEGAVTYGSVGGGLIAMRDRDNGTYLEDEKGALIVFNVQHLRNLSNARADLRSQEATTKAGAAREVYRIEKEQQERDLKDAKDGVYIEKKASSAAKAVTGAAASAVDTVGDALDDRLGPEAVAAGRAKGRQTDAKIRDAVSTGAGAVGRGATSFLDFIGRMLSGQL